MPYKKILEGLCYATLLATSIMSAPLAAKKNIYDFVIVGAGNAGCVLANRLSENGKYTVCILEAGRDDARLKELLPLVSAAPIPQPGDYNWGKYVRGTGTTFTSPLTNRGFGAWHFFQKEDLSGPDPLRSTTNHRYSGWGGCTNHNATQAVRNPPQNWDQWVALGLNEWSFDNINPYYKKSENRSQVRGQTGVPYYSTSVPLGRLGSFDPAYYGFNGMVPLFYGAGAVGTPFSNLILGIVSTNPAFVPFGYPNFLVDLDWPNRAAQAQGGLSLFTQTQTDQNPNSTIVPPDQSTAVNTNAVYNPYHDGGFQYPPEYARVGLTGLVPTQRVTAANTYLYAAENRRNLTIKSEVLVTKIILSGKKAKGVEYLHGWNIYQAGRNPDPLAGYGGSPGDAAANAIAAKKKGTRRVFARKEVIIAAWVYNTPQLLMLSGIGNKKDLRALDIKSRVNLPGVGRHLVDNQELFSFWDIDPSLNTPPAVMLLNTKSTPSQPYPNFEIGVGATGVQVLEATDPFTQRNWVGTRNIPSVFTDYLRESFNNILLDPVANLTPGPTFNDPNPPTGNPTFTPIMRSPTKILGCICEQEEHNRSEGYVQLVSKDPTVPPKIVMNYLSDPNDVQDWMNVMNNQVLPLMLALKPSGFFTNLLYPSAFDILKPGIRSFNTMADVDQGRLLNFLKNEVGGHHAGGTCKMGIESDPLAVVDQKGQVYGVKNLRICDNSILPVSIYWPNGTLYVIGEKISADILSKYEQHSH
jgi:choline dehydrogenase-like flavoprotein